jgi:uncharacterized membrane protein HdeD (DUF308 family)
MNIENILKTAVIPGAIAIALAVVVLSHVIPVSMDSVIGFGSVLVVAGIAALEYRISFKSLFGR